VFVDTPGVGGHGQPHLSATLGLLPTPDAMLMISDTAGVHRAGDDLHPQAFEICPVATIVATRSTSTRTGERSSRPTSATCSVPGSRHR